MCENTAINDGAAATQEPKPTYKLSEIMEAMKEDRVVLDTLGVLACVSEAGVVSLLDLDRLSVSNSNHMALLSLHTGLPQLMYEQAKMRPETMAIFAAANDRAKGIWEGGEA